MHHPSHSHLDSQLFVKTFLYISHPLPNGYALLFNWTTAFRASDSMTASLWSFNKVIEDWWYVFGLTFHGSTIGFH